MEMQQLVNSLGPRLCHGVSGKSFLFGFSLVKWTERIISLLLWFFFFLFSSAPYCGFLCFHIPEFNSFGAFFYRGWMVRDNLSFLFFSSTMNPSWNVTDCRIGGLSVYDMKASPTNNTFIVLIGNLLTE